MQKRGRAWCDELAQAAIKFECKPSWIMKTYLNAGCPQRHLMY